jgi:hypothetical protein
MAIKVVVLVRRTDTFLSYIYAQAKYVSGLYVELVQASRAQEARTVGYLTTSLRGDWSRSHHSGTEYLRIMLFWLLVIEAHALQILQQTSVPRDDCIAQGRVLAASLNALSHDNGQTRTIISQGIKPLLKRLLVFVQGVSRVTSVHQYESVVGSDKKHHSSSPRREDACALATHL